MIRRLWTALICRVTGWRCSVAQPSSKDLRKDMRHRVHAVEAQKQEIRLRRNFMEQELVRQRQEAR
jgi:hypothetical protein